MLVSISDSDQRPLYQQIADGVKEQIQTGALIAGTELPSVRELADTLGVNLHTVHRAYHSLRDEGYITMRLGRRARVAKPRRIPPSPDELKEKIINPLDRWVTESLLMGLSPRQLHTLLEEAIAAKTKGGSQ